MNLKSFINCIDIIIVIAWTKEVYFKALRNSTIKFENDYEL